MCTLITLTQIKIPKFYFPSSVAVRLGEHNTDLLVDCELDEMDQEHCLAPAIDVAIERAIKHNHYSEALSNSDIALLRLGQQIHFIGTRD